MSSIGAKRCPFCGHDNFGHGLFIVDQGYKWGRFVCGGCEAAGPEVRTGYDVSANASWHAEAIEEWNRRASPSPEAVREACAKVCENLRESWPTMDGSFRSKNPQRNKALDDAINAIRALDLGASKEE